MAEKNFYLASITARKGIKNFSWQIKKVFDPPIYGFSRKELKKKKIGCVSIRNEKKWNEKKEKRIVEARIISRHFLTEFSLWVKCKQYITIFSALIYTKQDF